MMAMRFMEIRTQQLAAPSLSFDKSCATAAECFRQKVRAVQRFGSPQAQAFFLRELFEKDVDVVEHFDVVARNPIGLQQIRRDGPSLSMLRIVSSTVGPIHGPPDMP